MPICSYLVIAESGACEQVAMRLSALRGCDVAKAENRDVLILVTDTPDCEEEGALRQTVEAMEGIQALLLTFGEIGPPGSTAGPEIR